MPITNLPNRRSRNLPRIKLGSSYYREKRYKTGNVLLEDNLYWQTSYDCRGGAQITESEGHPFNSRKKLTGDLGGDFYSGKNWVEIPNAPFKRHYEYNTGIADEFHFWQREIMDLSAYAVDPNTEPYPPSAMSSDSALHAKGATAIARCSPTNSIADLGSALGELSRDGLPSIPGIQSWETKTKLAVKAGSEFLNLVFGWDPLVADVRKSAAAIRRAQTIMRQFERDAGRTVRRRYYFPTEKTKTTTILTRSPYYGPTNGSEPSTCLGQNLATFRTRETIRKTWFSGAFTYHLPTGYNSRNEMDRISLQAKKLLGLDLSPDVLWELTPWSWATDWVFNTGDVIKNLSNYSRYGQVMRYGYIMEETTIKDTFTMHSPDVYHVGVEIAPVTLCTSTKRRLGANPFGFGITWDGLSALQAAILGALGITRH